MRTFRPLILGFAVLIAALALSSHTACAVYVLTAAQVDSDVVLTGSGTIDLTDLTRNGFITDGGQINAHFGILTVGPSTQGDFYLGATGQTSFGSGGQVVASSTTGNYTDITGFRGGIGVPSGYVSGSSLSGSATFNNATFTTLGFTPGTYAYTWGTGDHADSFVLRAVPEPSTWALLGVGAVGAGVAALRRRRTVA